MAVNKISRTPVQIEFTVNELILTGKLVEVGDCFEEINVNINNLSFVSSEIHSDINDITYIQQEEENSYLFVFTESQYKFI